MLLRLADEQVDGLIDRVESILASEWKDIKWMYLQDRYHGKTDEPSSSVMIYLCQIEPEWSGGITKTKLVAAYEGSSGKGASVCLFHVRHALGEYYYNPGGVYFHEVEAHDIWMLVVNGDVVWHSGERFRSWLVDLTSRVGQMVGHGEAEKAKRDHEAAEADRVRREHELLDGI